MKHIIQLIALCGIPLSAQAAEWSVTEYFPWIWDADTGWYYVATVSPYVWSAERAEWIDNPLIGGEPTPTTLSYPVVDTGQVDFYDTSGLISAPVKGAAFYGQDAQYAGQQPSYQANGDGTVSDLVTGLMWCDSPESNGDGVLTPDDKVLYENLAAVAAAASNGGYTDWRVPTIKELYSLILFTGTDPSIEQSDASGLTPYIDTSVFEFIYGDESFGERVIDSQYWSATDYVAEDVMPTTFGVNFADGRIKGYGRTGPGGTSKSMYLLLVRGNTDYGVNAFTANGDGTVSDAATGLMWMQADSGAAMDWEGALAWAEARNAEDYLGYNDWRVPNAKELQSIVDYTRSPSSSGSAAIDPVFSASAIINEAGVSDYGFYWSSTTHVSSSPQRLAEAGVYIAFGRSLGNMNGWVDIHGAGSQRSDPKAGDPERFSDGRGPQGDAVRIENLVRLVRNID